MLSLFLIGLLLHMAMLAILSKDRLPDGSRFSLFNRSGKGGSSTTVVTPTPPPQPSTADATKAWVESLPQVYETQMKYAPQEAQQQLELLQKYAAPMAQAYEQANQQLYPNTAKLQETLAGQALTGATATAMPDWMAKQYRDEFKAQLGTNNASPIGADYVSRGMQRQLYQQQQGYRDMGLSLAGRQPLSTPQMPQYSNYMGSQTPGNVMNFMGGNYSTYAQASRPFVGFSPNRTGVSLGILGNWGNAY